MYQRELIIVDMRTVCRTKDLSGTFDKKKDRIFLTHELSKDDVKGVDRMEREREEEM
jgi:hypothetical protein